MSVLKRWFGRQEKASEDSRAGESADEQLAAGAAGEDELQRMIRRLEIAAEGPLAGEAAAKRLSEIIGEYGLLFYNLRPDGAAERLGEIGDRRAVEPLIRALDLTDSPTQCAAIRALVKIGDRRAVEPLIELLEKDCWHSVTANAAWALGEFRDRRAAAALARATRHRLRDVRQVATAALKKLPGR